MKQARGRIALVEALHHLLEHIYDVGTGYQLADFLITDERIATALDGRGRANREKLLIRHHDDAIDLSLYLDEQALARLVRHDPRACLDDHNFADFCLVLEGISHFTYVAWNAAYDKRVTLLELELQAEVDKFVTASALLRAQRRRAHTGALLHRLFERFRLADSLRASERERYWCANTLARRYCQQLQRRLHRGRHVVAELRRFYRMPKLAKFVQVEAATGA